MIKITRYSIPIITAALIVTVRTEDAPSIKNQSQKNAAREQKSQLTQDQRNQQSTFQPGEISDSQLKKTVTDVNKASAFIGMAIKNMQNENVGKVHDLVFNPENGKISYAVLSVGGLLGVGDKLVAVPVTSLKPQPGQKYLMLNMDKNQIQAAPGLAQNNWPDLDDAAFGGSAGSETSSSSASGSPATSESSSSTTPQPPSTKDSQGTSPSATTGADQSSSSTTSDAGKNNTGKAGELNSSATGASASASIGSNSDASRSSTERSSSDSSKSQSDSDSGKDQ